jgi:REP element-mobilizing transposase RayT
MPHTFCSSLYHCVFSTKDRRPAITAPDRLWAYIGGIAHDAGITPLAIGGTSDHVHLLLSLPATVDIASAMRQIKSGSSRFLHEACEQRLFAWQNGYGAFSIGHAQIDVTAAYIRNQAEHHRQRDFQAEFIAILTKHEIAFDPRYLWD